MNVQRGHVRLDLEPSGYELPGGGSTEYDVVRGFQRIGRAWTTNGVGWYVTLTAEPDLKWAGTRLAVVAGETAYFLLDRERAEAHGRPA